MTRFALLLLAFLAACSEGLVPVDFDANMGDSNVDDGAVDSGLRDASTDSGTDAGPDATVDAGSDATADAAPDVEEPLPWPFFIEGDECDLITQEHIDGYIASPTQTCRRAYIGGTAPALADRFGAASFLLPGTMLEASGSLCSANEAEEDLSKRCAKNRFCIPAPGTCHRACDPNTENPCPNTDLGNNPQECVSTDRFPQPYCRWAAHL